MSATEGGALPRELGDGLRLRWATPEDTEALAAFNEGMHGGDPGTPPQALVYWTRDLMSGAHPTVSAGDFTIVEDTRRENRIVSTLCLISQTWAYEDISFGVGRPELVGTEPEYRRRGLVRAQMEAVHAKSAGRGELVQGITGIPWFYRQFGYEMTVNLGGGRTLYWPDAPKLAAGEQETYRLRPAETSDIPLLSRLYAAHCRASLLTRIKSEAEWRWEIAGAHPEALTCRYYEVIEDEMGQAAGYLAWNPDERRSVVTELAALPGHSLRTVCEAVARAFRQRAETSSESSPPACLEFSLSLAHPVYAVLAKTLAKWRPPYAWYLRVPDLPAFLGRIAPVLGQRLVGSPVAGYSGTLRLNFYHQHLSLTFAEGRLADAAPYTPAHYTDGDACFPGLTFLQLLFCHRSLADLQYAFPDCRANNECATVLLETLFPPRPSRIDDLA